MSHTAFYKGQVLGRTDLNLFLTNVNGTPESAAEISYALYDLTTGLEALVGPPERVPANPSKGEYYASIIVPLDANIGEYRIRWTFCEIVGGPTRQVVMGFSVVDRETQPGTSLSPVLSLYEVDLVRRLRVLTRDNNPDRNYHFRPPAHEETVGQYNRVFGFIWEDEEFKEFLDQALGDIVAAPPRTHFQNIDTMMSFKPEWRSMLITGAMYYAIFALRLNWIADEFSYSIGGVSLDLDKSSKYEAALQSVSERFQAQMEKAKATINILKGLQQPRFGIGIRSAFGPYVGRGVLSPKKFVGF